LIDRDGNTIASSNRNASDSFVGQNYAFRPYFKHAIKEDPTIHLGYMALGVTSGKRGIYYSHSVYEDGQDTPIGVAVIKAPIDPMEREFLKDYEGIVMLTDPHGIVFISNRTEWVLHTVSKLSSENMNDLIQEVVSLINTEAMIRNVSIETKLDGSLAPVLGDRIHLQQVIINFILNASEAMTDIDDAPRKIIISTNKSDQKMVKVGVRDFGSGIMEDKLDQIIEPFYTTKPEGMGMGLSINRSIIEAHAGRFWAENNPDRGATFYFTLPIHEEA